MAIRIKDKWHHSDRNISNEKSLSDNAGALAFIIWRLALEGAKNLHTERFRYDSDKQRIGVITEYLAFAVHYADRLVYERLESDQRSAFVVELAQRVAARIQENLIEIAGPGDYEKPFLDVINKRGAQYASFKFSNDEPGYDARRFLGSNVLEVMGDDQTNKWVMDQVMEIEVYDYIEKIPKSVNNLFGTVDR